MAGILLSATGFSQVTADIGIWGGGLGYMGDIEGKTLTKMNVPAFGAFFRYNLHQRTGIRLMFLSGQASAEGFIKNHPWQFPETGKKGVQDLTLQGEVNFLRYMIGNKKASFSSYLTAGLGFTHYSSDLTQMVRIFPEHPLNGEENLSGSVFAMSLPFGMGFKFNVGKRVGLGVEYQMRKIFDDRLDDLDDPLANNNTATGTSYTDTMHNNDWTGFLGMFLTYKIFLGNKPCPAYELDKK
jgi:hypothetical protein